MLEYRPDCVNLSGPGINKETAVASDYKRICDKNRQRYGTDIGRIGPMLLADRYDDRTHFIFELLQNAEDALAKRGAWNGPRRVTFDLSSNVLSVSHFGRPFDEADVRGVCGIAESTKGRFSIGRFGIGFKSVYMFTDRPEIHSGEEDFTIENYVQPKRAARTERADDKTQIVLPLKPEDATAQDEITNGFKRLGAGALLFLRYIDEINWDVEGGASGMYLRSGPVELGANAQRITVIGRESGQPEVDQSWLVFHRNVFTPGQEQVGRVEIAFSLQPVKDQPDRWMVVPVAASPLVVFFPTAVETNLGFLVQGPYKTTPSRDNIPRHEPWNKHLVGQTAGLLIEAIRWLRDNRMLDVMALRCLPLDREKFPEGSMFEPLFTEVRQVLLNEPLLPRSDGGYVAASHSKLARTQELRELFSPQQVARLFSNQEAAWLTGDITQDRAPGIRQYVMRELGVTEVTPETLVPRLNQPFLEVQSDEWIAALYEFLSGQPALQRRLDAVPLIRLSDGRHVVARADGQPQAFLPGNIETGFPAVRKAVCTTPKARSFLISLGITEPDLVDDVVLNVLQKYRSDSVDVDDGQYAKDIDRILTAFNVDSRIQREKLLGELRTTKFVMAVDSGCGTRHVDEPGDVYIATDRLKSLFASVRGVMIVEDAYPCLRGEPIRELLEACGAMRCPRPLEAHDNLSCDRRRELRRKVGHEDTSGVNDQVVDWRLQGFDELIELLPTLPVGQRTERARLLWESLGDLEERRGRGVFEGSYKWTHYGSYKTEFPSTFVTRLNTAAWVPDVNGELQPPRLVQFDSLGWKPNLFLISKIQFKPPIIDELAKEAGFDPAMLDVLRRSGITSVTELATRLGIANQPAEVEPLSDSDDVYGDAKDLYSDGVGGGEARTGAGISRGSGQRHGGAYDGARGQDAPSGKDANGGDYGRRAPGQNGTRPFISYVGTHPDEDGPDLEGLAQAARMRIEEQAIKLIIDREPTLRRTPASNPGFDLYEIDSSGQQTRWVEVKSMTGSLEDWPVGISRTQFECGREHGAGYWLYIVEYATDPAKARILKIQDPVGSARIFTFDRGWREIARTDSPS